MLISPGVGILVAVARLVRCPLVCLLIAVVVAIASVRAITITIATVVAGLVTIVVTTEVIVAIVVAKVVVAIKLVAVELRGCCGRSEHYGCKILHVLIVLIILIQTNFLLND